MAPDKNKIAKDCFKRGTEAMHREQWDYTIEMFTQAVTLVRDNVLFRQSLRGATRKMYKDNGSGARMSGMKLMKVRTRLKKAQLTKDWDKVDSIAEEGLKVNPWDAGLNAAIGRACNELDFSDVALFGYSEAVKNDTTNVDLNRSLAMLLEDRGNYSEAIACWQRILKKNPLDTQARSKVTQLAASSMMQKGNYDEAESTNDVKVKTAYDYDRPGVSGRRTSREEAADGPGMSQEADLERAIRKEPDNKDNYLKFADFLKRESRPEEAAENLQKALDITGGSDHTIREQLEDVELEQLLHNQQMALEAARSDPDDEAAKKNSVALAIELLNREIEVLSGRVERYPKDSRLKFELAKKHKRKRNNTLAIPLLQQAGADTRIACEVAVMLGECFFEEKKGKLALRQFEKAKELVDEQEQVDLFKKIQYALGRLYQAADKHEEAEAAFEEVLSKDYDYRDALKRLEKLQAGDDD